MLSTVEVHQMQFTNCLTKLGNTNVLAVVQSSFRSSSVVASVYASDSPADEGTRSIVTLDFSAAILSAEGKYSNL